MVHALRTTFPPQDLRGGRYCAVCQDAVDLADRAREDRVVYELEAWEPTIGEVDTLPGDDRADSYLRAVVRLDRPELRAVDEHGEVVEVVPPADTGTLIAVRVIDDGALDTTFWQVVLWDDLDELREREGV